MPRSAVAPRRALLRAATVFRAGLFWAAASAFAQPPSADEKTFTLALTSGMVPASAQRTFEVLKGDSVVLILMSDQPGEIHLHGYRLEARLAPGTSAEWRFRAQATGRFRFEWHADRGAAAHHHGPPLATLAVFPR